MKIRLALLEKDQSYLNRIVSAFSTKYADKFEIYSFTDPGVALATLDDSKIDVLVAADAFEIDVTALPKRCGFAYFVDYADVETVRDQRTICKFQKIDQIYKQILSIYSENAGNVSGLKFGDESCNIIAFMSPCGGVGTSSVAAACALRFAAQGKKTLYLNLEKFGSADAFFSADGQFDMSDVIFALKSKKTNLSLKLESCVKQDSRGVYFYSQSKIALDMLELGNEEVIRLISEARISGGYSCIIIDLDFGMDKNTLKILRHSHAIVWVGDGSDLSNLKITRAHQALSALEQREESMLISQINLVYNKFSSKTGKTVTDIEIRTAGGAPRFEYASTEQVLKQLSSMEMFDKIC